jgi:GT2 family glycosyltransferase
VPVPERAAATRTIEPGYVPAAAPRSSVSVIVPARERDPALHRCLQSIAAADPPPDEVIVVADGWTEDLPGAAPIEHFRLLRTERRAGPARARNLGARAARGEILYFVDADVALPRDAIARVHAAFACEPDAAAVFGSYDDEPAETNLCSQYKNLLHHHVHQTSREDASTFWSASGAIRRDVFLSVGGFDEAFARPSIEDIELGRRLRRDGHRIRLKRSLQVKHLKRYTAASLLRSDVLDRALPWSRLILREGRLTGDLNLSPASRVSAALACGVLACLFAALFRPTMLVVLPLLAAPLLCLNLSFYTLVRRKRGWLAAARVVPLHWLYYVYSSAVFAGCSVWYPLVAALRRPREARPNWAPEAATLSPPNGAFALPVPGDLRRNA